MGGAVPPHPGAAVIVLLYYELYNIIMSQPYISNDQLSKNNQYAIEILEHNASHLELGKLLKPLNGDGFLCSDNNL